MNNSLNELKELIKNHLKKRVDFDENKLAFFSLPYSFNLAGEGIENYLPEFVNLSLERYMIVAYLVSPSQDSTVYDYNNSQVYSISPFGNYHPHDEQGYLLHKTAEASLRHGQLNNGITGSIFDGYSSTSLSSPSVKFAALVIALFNANGIEISPAVFSSVMSEADSSMLGTNLDMNEFPGLRELLEKRGSLNQEKFSWSVFNELKLLRVSFEKKRRTNGSIPDFYKSLRKSFDLLKVLKASARVKSLSEFSTEQINGFTRRVPAEQKPVVDYLYRESVLARQCIDSIRSKDFEKLKDTVNESGNNLLKLGIADPGIVKIFNLVKDSQNFAALKISLESCSLNCLVHESDENAALNEINGKISVYIPEEAQNIRVFPDRITGIYVQGNH